MAERGRDRWDKADIVLKPVGGLLTALAVGLVGFFGSTFLERQQQFETNTRLYTELMTRREEADSALRRDMFNSIIDIFLKRESAACGEKVLSLELLARNFHESLNLAALFKHVHRDLRDCTVSAAKMEEYESRLENLAWAIKEKEITALEKSGGKVDGTIDLEELQTRHEGIKVVESKKTLLPDSVPKGMPPPEVLLRLDALRYDADRQEVRVQLGVTFAGETGSSPPESFHSVFWLGFYDFPMTDNTRLAYGQRCAIVLKRLQWPSAEITLVYFAGARAGAMEKLDYEEVLHLLRTRTESRS